MDCREARTLEDRHLDAELDELDEASIDAHLASCAPCRARFATQRAFHVQLKHTLGEATRAPPPDALRARVRGAISLEAANARRWPVGKLSAIAAVALAVVAAWPYQPSEASRMVDDLVDRHAANLPPEVRPRGDDDAELRRFLAHNLAGAVTPPPLAAGPVRLVGARVTNGRGHDIPYFIYDQRGAKLSYFAVPGATAPSAADGFERRSIGDRLVWVGARRGYNVVSWTGRGATFTLVSDVDARELVRLAGDVR